MLPIARLAGVMTVAAFIGAAGRPAAVLAQARGTAGPSSAEASQTTAPNAYGPDYNGEDFTRPQNYFELRIEDRTSGSGNPTDTRYFIPRFGGALTLSPDWKFGWQAQLPLVARKIEAPGDASQREFGVGDGALQGALIQTLSDRWAYGFGARIVMPTADDRLGGGKWTVMPGFGFRYSFLELGSDTYFVPKIRYAIGVAGDPTRRSLNQPEIAPTFNLGLPDSWFVTLYPSYDIRINDGAPISGQTGRLFLPLDVMVGRKLSDNLQVSLEIGVPIVKDYPVYNFKSELRIKAGL